MKDMSHHHEGAVERGLDLHAGEVGRLDCRNAGNRGEHLGVACRTEGCSELVLC